MAQSLFHRAHVRALVVVCAVAFLHGCGTTSSLQSPEDVASRPDLSSYDRVIVGDFADRATERKTFKSDAKGAEKKAKYTADVEAGGSTFAEYIVAEIRKTGAFSEVRRGTDPQPTDLYIDGDVTRYARGSAAAKFLVGLGAGSTYFDAVVRLHDGPAQDTFGTIVVDKNSWVLGGVISAAQNIESFMRGGAIKVAKELEATKTGVEPE